MASIQIQCYKYRLCVRISMFCAWVMLVACTPPNVIAQQVVLSQGPNCGINSVLAFAAIRNKMASPAMQDLLLKQYPQSTVSVREVKQMAAVIGLTLVGVKANLNELIDRQQPVIIHLNAPDHFVLLLDGSSEVVRCLETPVSTVTVVPRSDIERRFDGYALILSDEKADVPRIQFKETDFHFGVALTGQYIEHDYEFSNIGQQDLNISIMGST